MTYVEGFVLAVPTEKQEEYRRHAAEAAPLFLEMGITRHVETWGDDVPDGKVADFKGAVKAKDGEAVVFSWFEYPDRASRDAVMTKMMSDERMKALGENMPFDGQRMIVAGFDGLVEQGEGPGTYTDGFVVPVPDGNRDAYRAMADKAAGVFRDHGALRVVEAWGDDVPDGKVTDYKGAVKAEEGENIVFSFVEWPDKESRDSGWKAVMEDERLKGHAENAPFDGKRMIYGGFRSIFDTAREASDA